MVLQCTVTSYENYIWILVLSVLLIYLHLHLSLVVTPKLVSFLVLLQEYSLYSSLKNPLELTTLHLTSEITLVMLFSQHQLLAHPMTYLIFLPSLILTKHTNILFLLFKPHLLSPLPFIKQFNLLNGGLLWIRKFKP